MNKQSPVKVPVNNQKYPEDSEEEMPDLAPRESNSESSESDKEENSINLNLATDKEDTDKEAISENDKEAISENEEQKYSDISSRALESDYNSCEDQVIPDIIENVSEKKTRASTGSQTMDVVYVDENKQNSIEEIIQEPEEKDISDARASEIELESSKDATLTENPLTKDI